MEEKRKRGHPPWTEEQKQARRELNAKKRAEREAEELAAEKRYEEVTGKKRKKNYKRSDPSDPWTAKQRRNIKAAWDKKFAERDKEYKQLIADNPHKTKEELGIPSNWKPRDGSPSGYYGVMLRHARTSIELPPINIRNPHEVKNRIDQYFDYCELNNKLPNIVELANWLGVTRRTLQEWKDGKIGNAENEQVIQRAISVIEASLVSQVQAEPKIMVGGMFLLKSMFHYREQSDINFNVIAQNEQELSADEIAKRYLGDGKTVETEFVEGQAEDE